MWQDLTFWQQVGVVMLCVTAVIGVWCYGDSRGGWYILLDDRRYERAKERAKGGVFNGR